MISAVNKQYVYRLFIVALIGIKFCMYADTNVTIPGAKFPKHWFKNQYKTTEKPDLYIILGRSVVVCEKTAGLRSGNFLDLDSACLKVLVPLICIILDHAFKIKF